MKDILKKGVKTLRDVIELYCACICFLLMFFLFIAQIFWRYVLRSPLTWTSEAISILFVWMVLFGAIYSFRSEQHIRFTLICDMFPKKVGEIMGFLGNLLVLVLMVLSIRPTFSFIMFMDVQKSSVLRISMSIIFAPYLLFLIASILYTLWDMWRELRIILGKETKEETKI